MTPTATATELRVFSPFPMYAIPRLWDWTRKYRHRISDDFGHDSPESFADGLMARMENGLETWAVERNEELGGFVCVEPITPVALSFHLLFKPQFFAKDTVDAALREVFKELFKRDGIEKISTHIFEDNDGMRSMMWRLGGKGLSLACRPMGRGY